jgi:hypothetical protein
MLNPILTGAPVCAFAVTPATDSTAIASKVFDTARHAAVSNTLNMPLSLP